MKKLVVIRHGEYDVRYNLNDEGRSQMQNLSAYLVENFKGMKMVILSSSAPRALQSAEVIGEVLELPVEKHKVLWSGGDGYSQNNATVLNLVKEKDEFDVVMLVTHLEYCEEFPGYFIENALGGEYKPAGSSKGGARILDCETQEMEIIRPNSD